MSIVHGYHSTFPQRQKWLEHIPVLSSILHGARNTLLGEQFQLDLNFDDEATFSRLYISNEDMEEDFDFALY